MLFIKFGVCYYLVMVLIISRFFESTILEVVNWLRLNNSKFLILNSKCQIDFYFKINQEQEIFINDINLRKINSLWYRNGELNSNAKIEIGSKSLQNQINKFLSSEWKVLSDFFFNNFHEKKVLGDYLLKEYNKLDQLVLAKKCGFNIPNTIIGTKQADFDSVNDLSKITKPVNNIFIATDEDFQLSSYAKEITNEHIQNRKGTFFPSLIQEKIQRKYEIRIFFIKTRLFPMAIFNDNRNAIDIREYNSANNIRYVPYVLNNSIKNKIMDFINRAGLSTGSIDIIVTPQNEFYFLEVNPCGQYDYLNKYCNYYIEKEIANYLI